MSYRYPDLADFVPATSILPSWVRGDVAWDLADAELVREAAALLPAGRAARLVDIGAGTGRLLAAEAEVADEIVAVEPDPARLAVAREAAVTASAAVILVRSDVAAFGEIDRDFDLVVCSHVIQHIARPDRMPFVRAARSLVSAAGLLVLMFPRSGAGTGRYLLSAASPEGARSRTALASEADFDMAFAACPDGGCHLLPVWHAGAYEVDNLVLAAGCEILRRLDYRSFEFDVCDEAGSRPHRLQAVETCLVARLLSPGGP